MTSMNPPAAVETAKHQRGHLSRERLAIAGLKIARTEGLENLTMKRLAKAVAVTPMAIYRHFEDKSDLIDAVLDRFVQEQDICNHGVPGKDWAGWLERTYSNMYDGLQSMPSVYPYLSSGSRFGAGATDVVTQSLDVMEAAGFSRERAAQAASTLNGFVIGCAIMDNAFYQSLSAKDKALHSNLEPRLQTGLRLIISGLKHELSVQS